MIESLVEKPAMRTFLDLASEKGIESMDGYLCVLNGRVVEPSTEIEENERVFLIPIVSGG